MFVQKIGTRNTAIQSRSALKKEPSVLYHRSPSKGNDITSCLRLPLLCYKFCQFIG